MTNAAIQADSRPILTIGADDFAECPDCHRRLDPVMTEAGDNLQELARDDDGPIFLGLCPEHGGWRFQIEGDAAAPAAPCCEHCGNDGTEEALYIAVDCRWRPEHGAWELEQREDGNGSAVDCLACDKLTEDEEGRLFPYGMHLRPPAAVDGSLAFAAALSAGGDVVETIADGLDAACDGRGWDASHQRAADLANAAPAMLATLDAVLRECVTPGGFPDKGKGRTEAQQAAYDSARALVARFEREARA